MKTAFVILSAVALLVLGCAAGGTYVVSQETGHSVTVVADGRKLDCIGLETTASGLVELKMINLTFTQYVGCKEIPQ